MHRKPTPAENYRKAHINPQIPSQKIPINPLSINQQRAKETEAKIEPMTKSGTVNWEWYMELCKKLEDWIKECKNAKPPCPQEEQHGQQQKGHEHFVNILSSKLTKYPAAQQNVLADVNEKLNKLFNAQSRGDADSQTILDLHVSSVFSPRHTPGTTSPRNLPRPHQRSNEMSSSVPDFGKYFMRKLCEIVERESTLSVKYAIFERTLWICNL